MRQTKHFIWSILIGIIVSYAGFAYADHEPMEVLVFNSYNDQYSWTADLMSGITDVLYKAFPDIKIRVEYLDSKNRSDQAYFDSYYELMAIKYSDVDLDAVICTDDHAFNLVRAHREELFSGIPVFFCGINLLDRSKIINEEKFYGIVEKSSPYETIMVAKEQNPNLNKVYFIFDETISGRSAQRDVQKELRNLEGIETDFLDDKEFSEILDVLKETEPNSIAVYGFYVVDLTGEVYTVEYTTQKVAEAASFPVYGMWSFSLNHGIVGGKLISGYEHGKAAADLLVESFEGKELGNLYFIEHSMLNVYIYDYQVLKDKQLTLEKLPKESTIINQPVSFYEKHRSVILTSLGIILLLVLHNYILRKEVKERTKDLKHSLEHIQTTQAKLIESEKMASLGNLVFGVAHEVNTPLGNALTLASFVQREHSSLREKFENGSLRKKEMDVFAEEMDRSLNSLVKNLDDAASLVNAFKHIAVGNETDLVVEFDLREYLSSIVLTYSSSYGDGKYEILLNCPDGIRIHGKPGQYYQILSNLISNSMTHGFADKEEGIIEIDVYQMNHVIKMTYSDDGVGIPEKHREHVFEPFYTSKRGEGHPGLGLFTVYNAVKAMDGTIELSKEREAGILLFIEIPLGS